MNTRRSVAGHRVRLCLKYSIRKSRCVKCQEYKASYALWLKFHFTSRVASAFDGRGRAPLSPRKPCGPALWEGRRGRAGPRIPPATGPPRGQLRATRKPNLLKPSNLLGSFGSPLRSGSCGFRLRSGSFGFLLRTPPPIVCHANWRPRISSPAPAQSTRSLLMKHPQIRGETGPTSLHDPRNFYQSSCGRR